MRIGSFFLGLFVALLLAAGAFLVWAWKPEIAAVNASQNVPFDKALIAKGGELAAIGNCNECHTNPRQKPFAGARPLPTPFGTIHSTNITPDPETGIGRWSEAAFRRAMREGVDRNGKHLYPAFPYDHFTKITDADISALYAFLMTREPVRLRAPANNLPFPLNIRLSIAGWKLLFFRPGAFEPDTTKGSDLNRGAYLVQGLAHCGACHTPRNALGAEKKNEPFGGGVSEGWDAPAINAASPAPLPWSTDQILAYLRGSWVEGHGSSAGPMLPVTDNLSQVPAAEVRAIATYAASVIGASSPLRPARAEETPGRAAQDRREGQASPLDGGSDPSIGLGGAIYAGACAGCHSNPNAIGFSQGLSLSLSTSVHAPRSRNVIQLILHGIKQNENKPGSFMPGFDSMLTDDQIVALTTYLRSRFSDKPAWNDVNGELQKVKRGDPS
jgi:mono/diheme cytochrome c family protein